jgi:hypothetical protein
VERKEVGRTLLHSLQTASLDPVTCYLLANKHKVLEASFGFTISRRIKPTVLRPSDRTDLSSKGASETLRSSVETGRWNTFKRLYVSDNKFVGHELSHLADINSTRLGPVIPPSTKLQMVINSRKQQQQLLLLQQILLSTVVINVTNITPDRGTHHVFRHCMQERYTQ